MSKIKDALMQAEEEYTEEVHRAMDEWEYEKLSKIVFKEEK